MVRTRLIRLVVVIAIVSAACIGVIVALATADTSENTAMRLVVLALVAVAGVFALGVYLARRAGREIENRLERLSAAAHAIREGRNEPDIREREWKDIDDVAQAINRAAHTTRGRIEALGRERNQLVAILGSMVEGVIAVDAEQTIVHVNRRALAILGVEERNVSGKPVWEAIRISAISEATEAVMRDGREFTGETRIASLSGADRIVEIHAAPLRDVYGGSAGAVVVLFDLTELRRLEAVRRDFVANVSHELKTPLAAIRGLVETLIDDAVMPAHTRTRFLEKARAQTNRLSDIVTDLLTLSRVESQQDGPGRVPLDLRRIVLEVARLLAPEAETKGLILETHAAERLYVLGDDEALRQAVGNLVTNAIKYTPEGGRVTIRLREEAGWARLDVEDTGIGIEQKHLDRIFERFYRVDKARSRDLGGTGLGLSIVKHVCQSLGGHIAVASDVGKGSTFTVKLPLTTQAEEREGE